MMAGIKEVMPAIVIIALAYVINSVTKELGSADYIVAISKDLLSPSVLVAMSFILTALFFLPEHLGGHML